MSMEFENTPKLPPKAFLDEMKYLDERAKEMQPEVTESKGRATLRECKLNLLGEVKEAPVCISIVQNGNAIKFGTLGNMSLLIGRAKTKKTFAVSMVVAAAIPECKPQEIIQCSFPDGKKRIAYFDTEQSDFDVYNVIMRAFTLAGGKKEYFDKYIDVYVFAGKGPKEIIEAIDDYLTDNHDVGLVVIDGARDLILDILNSAESVTVATNFRRWTKDHNIHILTVLHQNKNDTNSRGHYGAELENKSETVAEIVKHKTLNISTVQPFRCRGKEFDKFSFEVDDNGIPHIIKDLESEDDSGNARKPKTPKDISILTHQEAIRIMFSTTDQISGSKIHDEIRTAYSGLGFEFGATAARMFLSYQVQNKLIKYLPHQKGNKSFYLQPETNEK